MNNKMQNREMLSVVGEKYRDLYTWEEEEALCKTVERALLVELFYENKGNGSTAVCEIRRRKDLLGVPMSTKGIRAMIKRFEETGKLRAQPESFHKHVTPILVDHLKTSEFGGSFARAVSRQTDYSYITGRKVLRKYNSLLPIHNPQNSGDA
ncbi:hypothetical protein TNCV_3773191 [Trichonephila clavipes]|nr:hypothetical protein TNCV_3773191 [Trichonephila clavipes]